MWTDKWNKYVVYYDPTKSPKVGIFNRITEDQIKDIIADWAKINIKANVLKKNLLTLVD